MESTNKLPSPLNGRDRIDVSELDGRHLPRVLAPVVPRMLGVLAEVGAIKTALDDLYGHGCDDDVSCWWEGTIRLRSDIVRLLAGQAAADAQASNALVELRSAAPAIYDAIAALAIDIAHDDHRDHALVDTRDLADEDGTATPLLTEAIKRARRAGELHQRTRSEVVEGDEAALVLRYRALKVAGDPRAAKVDALVRVDGGGR